jgi:hypothetical protein
VCVCSLSYPACNAHAPYCHLWPVWLYHIFPHYLINRTIFEEWGGRKNLLNTKCMFRFSLQLLSETFLVIRRAERDIKNVFKSSCGSGSVDGIATGYGLDGPGIESWRGEIFRTCPDRLWGPPILLYNGYWVFPGCKERQGHDADSSPSSSAVVMNE